MSLSCARPSVGGLDQAAGREASIAGWRGRGLDTAAMGSKPPRGLKSLTRRAPQLGKTGWRRSGAAEGLDREGLGERRGALWCSRAARARELTLAKNEILKP